METSSHPTDSTTERNQDAIEEPFSLTVDQYGRLWLHAKAHGIPIMLDLTDNDAAFGIMAATMTENDFDYRPVQVHEDADNDDQKTSVV